MAIAAALGPSIQNSMLAMLVVWWPPYARLARGQVLALRTRDFVSSAEARRRSGGRWWRKGGS